jgi:hypothetical protein
MYVHERTEFRGRGLAAGRIRSPHPTTISGTTRGPLTRRPPVGRRSVVLPVPHGSAKTRLGSGERLVEGGTEEGRRRVGGRGKEGRSNTTGGPKFGLSIKPSLSLLFSSSRGLARKLYPSSGRNL